MMATAAHAQNGGFTVTMIVYSTDGCFSDPHGSKVEYYNSCVRDFCETHSNTCLEVACYGNSVYRQFVVDRCREETRVFHDVTSSCPSVRTEILADSTPVNASVMTACLTGMQGLLPGRPETFYRASCRAIMESNASNMDKVILGILADDPNNLDNQVESIQAYCQPVDSGIMQMDMVMPDGSEIEIPLWRPFEQRYQNGCYNRLPPETLADPAFEHLKSYTPVPNDGQSIGSLSIGEEADGHEAGRVSEFLSAMEALFADDNYVTNTVSFDRTLPHRDTCPEEGLCGTDSYPFHLQTISHQGTNYTLPPLGPLSTPRLCHSLVRAAMACWRKHNDEMLFAEMALTLAGGLSIADMTTGIATRLRNVTRRSGDDITENLARRIGTNRTVTRTTSSQARSAVRRRIKERLGISDEAFERLFPCRRQ